MPVAALIVVGPGVEVKPVESDSLRANWNLGKARANLAIEAIFVHAEIGRGVAQPDKARHERGWFGDTPRSAWERARCGKIFNHRRPY
jgi:hypothetical protein